MFAVSRALGRELSCLSQSLALWSRALWTTLCVPLEARCLMKGLFCVSDVMTAGLLVLWFGSVSLELQAGNILRAQIKVIDKARHAGLAQYFVRSLMMSDSSSPIDEPEPVACKVAVSFLGRMYVDGYALHLM